MKYEGQLVSVQESLEQFEKDEVDFVSVSQQVASKAVVKEPVLLFKVLDSDMCSCHGGRQKWTLGKTYHVKGKLIMGRRGFHLTVDPQQWLRNKNCRVFFAVASDVGDWDVSTCVCKSARLLSAQNQNGITNTQLNKFYFNSDLVKLRVDRYNRDCALQMAHIVKSNALYEPYRMQGLPVDNLYYAKFRTLLEAYKVDQGRLNFVFRTTVLPVIVDFYCGLGGVWPVEGA